MTLGAAGRALLVVFTAVIIQLTIGTDLRIGTAHPEILWLLPITAGVVGGPERGAIMGFVGGIAADLFVPAPFGISALVGCTLGFVVGLLAAGGLGEVKRDSPLLAVGAALIGSAGAVMLYAVFGALLGQEQFLDLDLGLIVAVVSIANAILAVPAMRVMAWAIAPSEGSRRRSTGTVGRW
jgi:cell shape-determining protein MreD